MPFGENVIFNYTYQVLVAALLWTTLLKWHKSTLIRDYVLLFNPKQDIGLSLQHLTFSYKFFKLYFANGSSIITLTVMLEIAGRSRGWWRGYLHSNTMEAFYVSDIGILTNLNMEIHEKSSTKAPRSLWRTDKALQVRGKGVTYEIGAECVGCSSGFCNILEILHALVEALDTAMLVENVWMLKELKFLIQATNVVTCAKSLGWLIHHAAHSGTISLMQRRFLESLSHLGTLSK